MGGCSTRHRLFLCGSKGPGCRSVGRRSRARYEGLREFGAGGCNCSFRVPGLSGSGFRVDLEGSGFSLSLRFYDGVSGLYGV